MVYKFQCQCDVDYIGRTIQRLEVQVKQYIPWKLKRQPQSTTSKSSHVLECAIDNHLSEHYKCRSDFLVDHFSVLYKARSKKLLAFLEAIAITLYYLRCAGKENNLIFFICLENWVGIIGDGFLGFLLDISPHPQWLKKILPF